MRYLASILCLIMLTITSAAMQTVENSLFLHIITPNADYPINTAFLDDLTQTLENDGFSVIVTYNDAVDTDYPGLWHEQTLVLTIQPFGDAEHISISPYSTFAWPLEPQAISTFDFGVDVVIPTDQASRKDAAAVVIRGLAAYISGDCTQAIRFLSKIEQYTAQLGPTALEGASFYQGNCALLAEDYDRASDLFTAALNGNLDSAQISTRINATYTLSQLADEFTYLEGIQTLMFTYAETDLITPREAAMLRSRYGYALLQDNQFDAARDAITEAIAIRPGDADLYVWRGQVYLALFEWDNAFADYQTAIDIDPNYPTPYYFRGILHYSILQTGLSTREAALEDFEQYLAMAPDGVYAAQAKEFAASITAELEALNE